MWASDGVFPWQWKLAPLQGRQARKAIRSRANCIYRIYMELRWQWVIRALFVDNLMHAVTLAVVSAKNMESEKLVWK